MKQLLAAVMASFSLFCATAQAGIVMGGTRVIYQEGKREATITVTNMETRVPYLVQSWVENQAADDKRPVPFVVTPPLFRLDPEQENVLRISFTGAALPADRESVYWLCVKNISPTPKEASNKLQINVKSKFKLFWRPTGLGDAKDAWQKLTFTREGNRLVAHNPTPFYVSFYSLAIGGTAIPEPGMVAPLSSQTWTVNGSGQVSWRAINDAGGITDVAQQ
ncbi:molecular chaperone [Leclercia adecarboxylata]|uniref:fimbrial biogenesis chaperone n=1 Tax=Leclercia adecarboxylata TaxID=83655 RepID=UPI002DBC61A1|nr:molecular chaperone [Leclercia adecarboxylata]MEB6379019.1 molecular chaperone [Leclercia adecarboxylata]